MTKRFAPAAKRFAPAAERNRRPILDALRELLADDADVLEVASGTGQHAAFFAVHLPGVTWQPSECDEEGLASIAEYRADCRAGNLLAPKLIDVREADWGVGSVDAVLCCNMIHIAPWACAEGLFAGAGRVLREGGMLLTYGPYRFDGKFTAPSNQAFDRSLRQRDASWGVRDTVDLARLAAANHFVHERTVDMPSNNHILVFRKRVAADSRVGTG